MANARVAIIMGSQSDWSVMQSAEEALEALGITCDVRIISAHRTPERLTTFIREAEEGGIEAIIAGAGCAAHLAGVTAAHTVLPVLGVPLAGSALNGMDALLATVQMPGGIPVATFAIGRLAPRTRHYLPARSLRAPTTRFAKSSSSFARPNRRRYRTCRSETDRSRRAACYCWLRACAAFRSSQTTARFSVVY